MADTVGKQRIRTDANTDVQVSINNAAGTNTAGVDASSNLQVNLNAQGLAGVKTSRDGAAPTAANGIFTEITTANAVLGVGNALPTKETVGGAVVSSTNGSFANILQGNAVLSASNGIFTNQVIAGAVLSATNGIFTNLLQGNAVLSATNGTFANLLQGNAVLAVGNPLPMRLSNGAAFNSASAPSFTQLSNGSVVNALTAPAFVQLSDGTTALGTSTNPIVTSSTGANVGTTVYRHDIGSVTSGATTNIDYTVTALKTLTIESIVVSCSEAGHYQLIIDPTGTNTSKLYLYTAPGATTCSYTFIRPLTVAAGLVVRIAKTNDSHQSALMTFTWEGYEV